MYTLQSQKTIWTTLYMCVTITKIREHTSSAYDVTHYSRLILHMKSFKIHFEKSLHDIHLHSKA